MSKIGLKMCITKVWGVLGGKPWFYTFWGSEGGIWGLVYLAHIQYPIGQKYTVNTHHHRGINIILYIYIYTGGGYIGGIWGIGLLLIPPLI
jgi:hypothetical protein